MSAFHLDCILAAVSAGSNRVFGRTYTAEQLIAGISEDIRKLNADGRPGSYLPEWEVVKRFRDINRRTA